MTDIFTWQTQASPSATETVSVLTAQFGDGYKQVAANGINTASETWSLTWTGRKSDVADIRAFLRTHVVASFWWTNPWGEKNLYRVKNDSIAPQFISHNVVALAFTFEQAFAP